MNKPGSTPLFSKHPAGASFFWMFAALMLVFSVFCFYKPGGRPQVYHTFNRTWGFDHITLYSPLWQIVFFLIAFLIILPVTNRLLVKLAESFAATLAKFEKWKLPLFALVSIISALLFFAFKTKYFFLGDFNLRLEQIMRGEVLATEYLTMKMLYYFAKAGERFGYDHYHMFEWYSCIAGGVFVFFSCLIADVAGENRFQKLVLLLIQLSTSLLLVFCGYIEVYATPVVFISMYLFFSLRYLKYKRSFYLVLICLALAIAAHALCVALIPSLVVLWYFSHRSSFAAIAKMSNSSIALAIATLLTVALVAALRSGNGFVLPVTAPVQFPTYLTFFSWRHFWEVINGQLLACGLCFPAVLLLLWQSVRKHIALPGQVYFLLCLGGGFLFLVLLANLHRGSCDWDIMAFPAIFLNLLAGWLILILYKDRPASAQYLLVAIIGLNALNAALWLHINHTSKSIKKLEQMLTGDPGTYYSTKLHNFIQLVMIYKGNHLWEETERAALMACDNYNDLSGCITYAAVLSEQYKKDQAAQFFEEMLSRTVYLAEAYIFLVEYFEKKHQYEKLYFYLSSLLDHFVLQPDYFMGRAKPNVYRDLFQYLYAIEGPKKDQERIQKIAYAMQLIDAKQASIK